MTRPNNTSMFFHAFIVAFTGMDIRLVTFGKLDVTGVVSPPSSCGRSEVTRSRSWAMSSLWNFVLFPSAQGSKNFNLASYSALVKCSYEGK